MDPTRFFARTTRGIEDVTAEELRTLPEVRVCGIEHRLVFGETGAPLAALAGLRTADDVFLELACFDGMTRARASLALLEDEAKALTLAPALRLLRTLRPIADPSEVYVRASFVGRRNYSTAEIEETLASGLARQQGIRRAKDDGCAGVHVRLVLADARARIGLRLCHAPLHERSWKRAHVPGSLQPAVAAALWHLAGLQRGMRTLDPCCGAGTLVAEAALHGACGYGGDRCEAALHAARENLGAAGVPSSLSRWDAGRLPLADASIGCAASNLPWGRQVATDGSLSAFHADVARELDRVLVPGARAALLTGTPDFLADTALATTARREIHLFGQRPTVVVLAREARSA